MTTKKLERAYLRILEILRSRPEDGRKFVPIAQHLERELQAFQCQDDDYQRYMRMADGDDQNSSPSATRPRRACPHSDDPTR
jgi:hypothetical protein